MRLLHNVIEWLHTKKKRYKQPKFILCTHTHTQFARCGSSRSIATYTCKFVKRLTSGRASDCASDRGVNHSRAVLTYAQCAVCPIDDHLIVATVMHIFALFMYCKWMSDLIVAGLIQFQLIVKRISSSVCNIVWSIIRLICKATAAVTSTITTHTNRTRTTASAAATPSHRSNEKMINKTYKLLFGIVLLVIVDIVWVSSSELTKVCVRGVTMRCTSSSTNHSRFILMLNVFLIPYIQSSFSTKMKDSINHFSAHTLKRQCLRCTYWC